MGLQERMVGFESNWTILLRVNYSGLAE